MEISQLNNTMTEIANWTGSVAREKSEFKTEQ
jgi:hypothetical protein